MNRLKIKTNFAKVGKYLSPFVVESITREDTVGFKYSVEQLNKKAEEYLPKINEIIEVHQIEGEHVKDDLCLMLLSIYVDDYEQYEDAMNEGRVLDFFFKKMPDAVRKIKDTDGWRRNNSKLILSVDGVENIEVPEFLAHDFINHLVSHFQKESDGYKPTHSQNVGPEQIKRRSLAYAFSNYLYHETSLTREETFDSGKDLMKIAGYPFNKSSAFRKMFYAEQKRRSYE